MKKLFSTLILALFATCPFYAQTPANQDKRAFRSEEDNRLYINKDLGIYIWISTSPDPESEKHRLISDSSIRYTNPMYFDTEGYNTVRSPSAVDTSTKQVVYPLRDIIFEVYADGLPPVSKAVYRYSLTRTIGGKKYFDSGLKIELQSSDAVSGVESVFYSLNSEKFIKYTDVISAFHEGENTLRYYGVDKVGNVEKMKEEIFYIDKTPPKTTYNIEGNKSDKYVSSDALIKLTSTDNISGVKDIFYRINDGKFVRYTTPIPAKALSGAQATISFYAEDNMENKENVQTIGGKNNKHVVEGSKSDPYVLFEFYVDKDPPVVSLEVGPNTYKGNYTYVSPRSLFTIKAEDDKSGVEKVFYSINKNIIDIEYNKPFALENKGLNTIRTKATDYVGNTSVPVVQSYFFDPDPPKSSLQIGNPKYLSRDTLFVTSITTFTITSKDEGAGTGAVFYSINNAGPKEFTTPFNLDKSGYVTLQYFSRDNVNNNEEPITAGIYVDNEPPVIHHHFSVESIGNKNVRDETYTIFPANIMLYIAATDARSGGEKIEYSVNGSPLQTTNPLKSFKAGNYIIKVNAYDVLGNKSSKEIKFAVEE